MPKLMSTDRDAFIYEGTCLGIIDLLATSRAQDHKSLRTLYSVPHDDENVAKWTRHFGFYATVHATTSEFCREYQESCVQ